MMKRICILTLMVLCMCSPENKTPDCVIDFEFKAKFQNCISIIAVRQAGVYVDKNAYDAYYCLQALTKEKGFMDFNSDTPLSYNYSDTVNFFCKDLENWLVWYDKNKCQITLTEANSILQSDSLAWPKYLDEFNLGNLGCVLETVKE